MTGTKLSDDHDLLSSNYLLLAPRRRTASRGRFQDGLRDCNGDAWRHQQMGELLSHAVYRMSRRGRFDLLGWISFWTASITNLTLLIDGGQTTMGDYCPK
jgi:hypothetical protein